MASEPKMGDVRQDGSLRQQVWLGSGWYYVGSPIATKLVSAELSAAREMREVLRKHQWASSVYPEGESTCPECGEWTNEGMPMRPGHAPDCRLARLIGGGE